MCCILCNMYCMLHMCIVYYVICVACYIYVVCFIVCCYRCIDNTDDSLIL